MPLHFKEKKDFAEGILFYDEFALNYDLRCYEPSPELAPFVEHYFISRRRQNFNHGYVGEDVLSQPVASLFFTPGKSFVQGPSTGTRHLIAKTSPIYAGAQFRPGGFYPFWHRKLAGLAEKTMPASDMLPGITTAFTSKLLALDDQAMLAEIDSLLKTKRPKSHPHQSTIEKIIDYIETNGTTATVYEVARHFGMSERSLQHLFHIYVGVGVKWVIMRARFLQVLKYIRHQREPDWAKVAAQFGYSDQSHFINDFKKLVGVSPRQYESILQHQPVK